MEVQIRQLHPLFGAEISGVSLADCDSALATQIRTAIGKSGIALFRGVEFDDAGLARFAAALGPLQNMSSTPGAWADISRITNLDDEGAMRPAGDAMRLQQDANKLWHMDSTFRAPGATFSYLHARIIPPKGGDTELCDTRAAWDSLSREQRTHLEPLAADHSIFHSRRLIGFEMTNYTPSQLPPIRRKLVRRHKPSGRDALIVASHIERIEGMQYEQARALVEELTAIAAAPERVYRHEWKVGDLLMWDNRCILHRATPFAQFDEARDMRSCRNVDVDDNGLANGAL